MKNQHDHCISHDLINMKGKHVNVVLLLCINYVKYINNVGGTMPIYMYIDATINCVINVKFLQSNIVM